MLVMPAMDRWVKVNVSYAGYGSRGGRVREVRVNVDNPGMVRTVRINVVNVPSLGPEPGVMTRSYTTVHIGVCLPGVSQR